ncbi:MAG: hypothetical protein HQ519_03515 [Planctomycetes bacterium]|nr:hypothetical protein [Planctomycetota bacterium]
MPTRRFQLTFAITVLALSVILSCASCQSKIPNQNVVGSSFPSVVGVNLDGNEISIPDREDPRPTVLLIGYSQDAQFDADRWLLGLLQAETPVRLLEVPTIPGLFMEVLLANTIDNGMRKGIPSEDWAVVVTLYGDDAEQVKKFTGNTGDNNIRAALLNQAGKVLWFHDRGYSAGKLLELDRFVRREFPQGSL